MVKENFNVVEVNAEIIKNNDDLIPPYLKK
jgi:hypothetical protein